MLKFISLLAASVWLATPPAVDHCDPLIARDIDPQNKFRYENRDDRCEGIYGRNINFSGTLLIASLTSGLSALNSDTRSLAVQWQPSSDAGDVHIRAYSLRRRLFYRMDTTRAGASGVWRWPLDLLHVYKLWPPEIGLVAWSTRTIDGAAQRVYLPLSLGSASADPAKTQYRLLVVTPDAVDRVKVSIRHHDPKARLGKAVQDATRRDYGAFGAGAAIPLALPPLPIAGLYRIEITATMDGGGDTSIPLWLERPAR